MKIGETIKFRQMVEITPKTIINKGEIIEFHDNWLWISVEGNSLPVLINKKDVINV